MNNRIIKKPEKIPTIVGIFLIIIIIGTISLFMNNTMKKTGLAQFNPNPQNITVTSVTDTSFIVTWEIDKPSFPALQITDQHNKKQIFFDERYEANNRKKHTTASIPVRGLNPQTEYKIEFIVNGKYFTDQYVTSIRTGPTLSQNTNGMTPIYGSVLTEENKPAEGALVFLTFGKDSQLLSTIVKPSGSWMIPLNLLRSQDLTRLIEKTDEVQTISIKVRLDGKESTVITDTLTMSPVPPITLGNNHDFRGQARRKINQTNAKSFSSVLGEFTTNQRHFTIQLINPRNNAVIPGDPPLFSGTGIPENIVTLLIGTENPKVHTTKVQSDGTWRFSPEKPIGIGNNRVTMTTLNEKNTPVTITHEFQIMKSGTQVLGDATPSATLMPTVTAIPLPTDTPTPTLIQEIPTTGHSNLTNILLIAGLMMILGGLFTLAW